MRKHYTLSQWARAALVRVALLSLAWLVMLHSGRSQSVTQAHPNPDCQNFFSLTVNGAASWSIVYTNSGFSPVSVLLQSAQNNAGVPASFGTGFTQQTIITGSNPQTDTTAGYLWVTGTNAFVRVQLTATGSGIVQGSIFGWRIPNAQ